MAIKVSFIKMQHKAEKTLIFLLLCAVCVFIGNSTARASQGTGKTYTLKGKISGSQSLPEDIKHLVLAGVTGTEYGDKLYVPEGVTIELKEGTENAIDCIMGPGDMTIVGSGSIVGGSEISSASGTLTIDLSEEGVIDMPGGSICNYGGSIVINNGRIHLISGEYGGGSISAMSGDLRINGGEINLECDILGLYSDGKIQLLGGNIDVSGRGIAMMALEGIEQDNGSTDQLPVAVIPNDDGKPVAYPITEDGELAETVHISDTGVTTGRSDTPEYSMKDVIKEDEETGEERVRYEEALKEISPLTVTESRSDINIGQGNSSIIGKLVKRVVVIGAAAFLIIGGAVILIMVLIKRRKRKADR